MKGFAVRFCVIVCLGLIYSSELLAEWTEVPLTRRVSSQVRPWTGMVLWHDHEDVRTDAIAMEYSYVGYGQCAGDEKFDWTIVEDRLSAAASRGHQSLLRFYFVYPGRKASIPPDARHQAYEPICGTSEGKRTEFVDWSSAWVQAWLLGFHREFAARYDNDPRLAAVQVGFGLWAEYHIYDGPSEIGRTFPSKEYQSAFLRAMDRYYIKTPWMISVDAADVQYSPIVGNDDLVQLHFGLFDDSFLSKGHAKHNEVNWRALRSNHPRYAGGEISYYTDHDQRLALSKRGPHGEPFEIAAGRFNLSFMIGNDQPQYQTMRRIRKASLALGYRLAVTRRRCDGKHTELTVKNIGIAAPPHPIDVAIGDAKSKPIGGLPPGQEIQRRFEQVDGDISMTSIRLVSGQTIPFDVQPPE